MKPSTEKRTMSLWPTAGRLLGLGKNAAYVAALRGEIPGVFRVGKKWLVSIQAFDRALEDPAGGTLGQPTPVRPPAASCS